jgi:hypothetical protein
MGRQVLAMMMVFTASMTAMICATVIILRIVNRRSPRLGEQVDVANRLDDISDRLGRLDGSIDAMAVEIERISEAQRFTARVLAERPAPVLPDKSRPGVITPH